MGLWLDDFSDANVRDPRYLDLAAKVRCVANAECDAIFPNQFPAVLRIKIRDGQWLEERVMANRGGPDNPLSVDELKVKFLANATRRLSQTAAESLAETILHLTEITVGELCSKVLL